MTDFERPDPRLEAAARALWRAQGGSVILFDDDWANSAAFRDNWSDYARAAVVAFLRQPPSRNMVSAAVSAYLFQGAGSGDAIWQAMSDQAVAELTRSGTPSASPVRPSNPTASAR